jgi:ABC-2 type transport system permease protein
LLPALIATWLSGAIFIVGVALLAVSTRVFAAIITPGWLIVFLLWTPALALIGIALMVAVSSRVNDPRTAQQFSAVLVVPFLGLFIGQISGLLILGPIFALTVFLILLALVVLAIWIVTQLFQREVILTRWK